MKHCKDCPAWVLLNYYAEGSEYDSKTDEYVLATYGECHLHGPKKRIDGIKVTMREAEFPITSSIDFCFDSPESEGDKA